MVRYCRECSEELREDTKQCSHCGEPQIRLCPSCPGKQFELGETFCDSCRSPDGRAKRLLSGLAKKPAKKNKATNEAKAPPVRKQLRSGRAVATGEEEEEEAPPQPHADVRSQLDANGLMVRDLAEAISIHAEKIGNPTKEQKGVYWWIAMCHVRSHPMGERHLGKSVQTGQNEAGPQSWAKVSRSLSNRYSGFNRRPS